MVKMNRLLMVAIIAIALVALTGLASAKPVPVGGPLPGLTVTADTVQTNGRYIGTPVLLQDEIYHWGYNYTLVPDGSYTVFGTITNELNYSMVVHIVIGGKSYFESDSVHDMGMPPAISIDVNVPAAGSKPATVGYSVTLPAGYVSSSNDISGEYFTNGNANLLSVTSSGYRYNGPVDFSNVDYVDAPQQAHTLNYGPMSDMVVIFNNGVLKTNATVMYSLNVSGDDYKALYTNGKMDFHGSPLYSFAE